MTEFVKFILWIFYATLACIILNFVRYKLGFEDMVLLGFVYAIAHLSMIVFTLRYKK